MWCLVWGNVCVFGQFVGDVWVFRSIPRFQPQPEVVLLRVCCSQCFTMYEAAVRGVLPRALCGVLLQSVVLITLNVMLSYLWMLGVDSSVFCLSSYSCVVWASFWPEVHRTG